MSRGDGEERMRKDSLKMAKTMLLLLLRHAILWKICRVRAFAGTARAQMPFLEERDNERETNAYACCLEWRLVLGKGIT